MVFATMNHAGFIKILNHPKSILHQTIKEHQEQHTFVLVSSNLHMNDIFLHFINETMTSDQKRQGIFVFNKPIKCYLQVTFISKKAIGITSIYNSFNGLQLAESHVVYIFLNMENRKASVLPKHIQQKAGLIKQVIVPQRIEASQRTSEAAIHTVVSVREENIDINNHTNMGFYLTCAFEAFTQLHSKIFPGESNRNLTEIQALNKMESFLGDELHITAWFDAKSETCNCTITTGRHLVMFLKGRYASPKMAKL